MAGPAVGSVLSAAVALCLCLFLGTSHGRLVEEQSIKPAADLEPAILRQFPCTSTDHTLATSMATCAVLRANATGTYEGVDLTLVLVADSSMESMTGSGSKWFQGAVVGDEHAIVRLCQRASGAFHGSLHVSQGIIVLDAVQNAKGQLDQVLSRPEGWLKDGEALRKRRSALERASRKRRDGPANVCKIYLDADVPFLNVWGGEGTEAERKQRASEHMLDFFFQAEGILSLDDNLGDRVNLQVAGFTSHTTNYFQDVASVPRESRADVLLSLYQLFLGERALARDDAVTSSDVCLNYLFTFNDLNSVLGIAIQADTRLFGGVCAQARVRNSQNQRVATNVGYVNSRASTGDVLSFWKLAMNLAHEISHSFGAPHDCSLDPTSNNACAFAEGSTCVPTAEQGGHYLMYPSTAVNRDEPNGRLLSPCSLQSMFAVLDAKDSCFVESTPITSSGVCDMTLSVASPCSKSCGGGELTELYVCQCSDGSVDTSGQLCGLPWGYASTKVACAPEPCTASDSKMVRVELVQGQQSLPDVAILEVAFRQALGFPVQARATDRSSSAVVLFLQACESLNTNCIAASELDQLISNGETRTRVENDLGVSFAQYNSQVVDGPDDSDDFPLWAIVLIAAVAVAFIVFMVLLISHCMGSKSSSSQAGRQRNTVPPTSDGFIAHDGGAAAGSGGVLKRVAIESHVPSDPSHLGFEAGAVVTVWSTSTHMGPEWWFGSVADRTGFFPRWMVREPVPLQADQQRMYSIV